MFDRTVPALLLRLDSNVFHHGTLGAIRSLGRAGVEVHGLVEGAHAPTYRSRYLARMHTWSRGRDTVQALTRVAERIGRRAVLLTLDDAGAIAVAEHAAELRPYYLLPDQPPGLPRRLADKRLLHRLCTTLGVLQPETRLITGADDAAAAVADLGLPLVAKWAQPWLLPAGLRRTGLVRGTQQVARLLQHVAGGELLFQRFVPGGPGSDWFFHGYFDEHSHCLYGGAGRKERAYPRGAGLTTWGRWLPNPVVEGMARELAMTLGYRGVVDIDFRHDPAAGTYHLLDFNPRLGAQFRLFADGAGLDLVRAAHLHLSGRWTARSTAGSTAGSTARSTALGRAGHGRTYVVENYDLFTAGPKSLRALCVADELAWLSADDPRPFVGMAGQTIKRGFARLAGSRRQ
ncbi:ATP-grasp domain-containing protein [Nonomuraea mesophila]|uniref:ATP-grasp domain-containing protein n=1 Tax=Nonomuraea mesophila TaxID=2530382 RepID=A0A4V2Z8U0_9ACTN|nr:ATP-grasp domain-containing protein [Nonomuraea mesophila]TDE41761.1 ATP-grasp domain-containing protein [Nonomuraea mesophila]